MNSIINGTTPTKKQGIKNVHNRLRMLFGEKSGLSFYKKDGDCFVVALTILLNNDE